MAMDNLSGQLVNLRPIKESDLEYLVVLRNDMRTQGWNQRLPPCYTPKKVMERIKKNVGLNKGIWAIETKNGKIVGQISYDEERVRLSAAIGILTGTEAWGKGYAKEAMELILRFLFEERGLRVAILYTLADRVRMIGLAEKLGFRISVRMRESAIIGGKAYDMLIMDLLREEYYSSRNMPDGMPALKR